MKKIKLIYLLGVLISFASCKKFLDINQNPNDPTSSSPELMLGQAITYSAANMVTYHAYGGWMVGYITNAGGYGGWGSAFNYNYNSNSYTGVWTSSYDVIQDYQIIQEMTEGDDLNAYYNAVARIMKVFHYQILVDNYNDVPYSEANQGIANLYPKYDKAEDIYVDLSKQIDTALNIINNAQNPRYFNHTLGNADPMFKATTAAGITLWKQFANTLKLRLLIRAFNTPVYANMSKTFDAAGFLTTDATVNPGYVQQSGQQSPFFTSYHSSPAGGGAARSNITSYYVVSFYDGNKISDYARAKAIYRDATSPVRNQTGINTNDVPPAPTGSSVWYSGTGTGYANSNNHDNAIGVLKGRTMATPMLLAAESYFLQAEGALKGIISGDVETLFDKGIEASFLYLYKSQDGTYKTNSYFNNVITGGVITESAVKQLAVNYKTEEDNETNYLVNIDLATTPEQQLEAIITQKYIALNMIAGHEAWAEFRRTGYPTINNSGLDKFQTFVSVLSASTNDDKTIGRLIYPDTEYQLNTANVPAGIDIFSSYVFWDRRK